jgi:hypothetical protein
MRADRILWILLWKFVREEPASNFVIGLKDLIFHIEALEPLVQIVKDHSCEHSRDSTTNDANLVTRKDVNVGTRRLQTARNWQQMESISCLGRLSYLSVVIVE